MDDPNIPNIRETVLGYLLRKMVKEATELLCETFLNRNHVFTIRDDEKCEMWVYNEGIYIPEGKSYIKQYCRDILYDCYNAFVVNQVVNKIEVDTFINPKDFFEERNFDEIPVLNGILNIKTRNLRPYDPTTIFFNKINIEYDVDKEIHKIKDFFYSILSVKEVEILQELFGYVLYKKYDYQKAFMFLGSGSNGKSVLIDLFKRFVSAENTSSLSLHQIQDLDSFGVAELFNKMINLSGDISSKVLTDAALFKQIIGGERIGANRKFKNMIYFHNYAKFINSCNKLPKTSDVTDGFFRRWVILNFDMKFITEQEYNKLSDKERVGVHIADERILEHIITPSEMSGLLNWSLEGLDRLFKNKCFSSCKSTKEIRLQWTRLSNSFEAFFEDCIEEDFDGFITKSNVAEEYKRYCNTKKLALESNKSIKYTLEKDHGCWIERRFIDDERPWVWCGIKLK